MVYFGRGVRWMKERRYKKDFRIVTDVDPRTGRARERAVYSGEYYCFAQGEKRRLIASAGICTALYWLGALGYLFAGRVTSHCVYALVPVIASLLPGAYLVFGLVALAASPGRMTLVQKENGPGRVVRASVGCGLLSSAGAVGCAVFLTVSGQWAGGWSEPLLTAAASAAAWAAFATGRRAYMKIERA